MSKFSSRSILIVEDEPLILIDAIDMVEDEGFKCYEAANAAQALQVLEQNPDIDVLFTDIDMPGSVDGLMLAQIVRQRWPKVAIIVVSGRYVLGDDALPNGGRFLPKPYLRSAVLRALRATERELPN